MLWQLVLFLSQVIASIVKSLVSGLCIKLNTNFAGWKISGLMLLVTTLLLFKALWL